MTVRNQARHVWIMLYGRALNRSGSSTPPTHSASSNALLPHVVGAIAPK